MLDSSSQKNAETPLSLMYDGKSALEQMHCHLLLRVMRHHGLGALLDRPNDGVHVRKLLWQTVLATDMSVHDDFMARFEKALSPGESDSLCYRQILICQAIMKCADISNPVSFVSSFCRQPIPYSVVQSRPYPVSQHWAGALMREWSSQAMFERHLALPLSVQSSNDPLIEAKGQVFFTKNYAKPLLDLVVQAVPGAIRRSMSETLNLLMLVTSRNVSLCQSMWLKLEGMAGPLCTARNQSTGSADQTFTRSTDFPATA